VFDAVNVLPLVIVKAPVLDVMVRPLMEVAVAAPRAGVTNVGELSVLFVRVSVEDVVTTFTPSIDTTPAETLASVVSVACPSSTDPTPIAVLVEAVNPAIGRPVTLVSVPELGVPKAPPETKLPDAVPVNAPTKVVALTVLANVALWSAANVRAVVAVLPDVVVRNVRVRLAPVPEVIIILLAAPVMSPTEVKPPVTFPVPSKD
jgi:hypothetical protein